MEIKKNKNGFTLIELLVVVAIIGILATIVLSSLSDARNRSKDANIKSTLSNMRAQAELIYLETGSYDTICDLGTVSGDVWRELIDSVGGTTFVCGDTNDLFYKIPTNPTIDDSSVVSASPDANGNYWLMEAMLSDNTWFCVDSSGVAKSHSTYSTTTGNARTCL